VRGLNVGIVKWSACTAIAAALSGCMVQYALFGFPAPRITLSSAAPVEMPYREGPGGLVILTARVNDRADVDFILDTGAPVTVLIDNAHTASLGLDSSKAAPLGDRSDPATPVGVIQDGFALRLPGVGLADLTAVVVPGSSMPCRERFDAIAFGGVIGADLFRRFVVEVDGSRRIVRLHEPAGWRPPAGSAVRGLEFERGHAFVEADVRLENGSAIASRLHFDTGMNKAVALVAGEGSPIPMPSGGTVRKSCYVAGVREEVRGPPVVLVLGSESIPVPAPTYVRRANAVVPQRGGAIGIEAFRGRRFFIDYPSRRLVIPAPAPSR
jgi:hypothetical protein